MREYCQMFGDLQRCLPHPWTLRGPAIFRTWWSSHHVWPSDGSYIQLQVEGDWCTSITCLPKQSVCFELLAVGRIVHCFKAVLLKPDAISDLEAEEVCVCVWERVRNCECFSLIMWCSKCCYSGWWVVCKSKPNSLTPTNRHTQLPPEWDRKSVV